MLLGESGALRGLSPPNVLGATFLVFGPRLERERLAAYSPGLLSFDDGQTSIQFIRTNRARGPGPHARSDYPGHDAARSRGEESEAPPAPAK